MYINKSGQLIAAFLQLQFPMVWRRSYNCSVWPECTLSTLYQHPRNKCDNSISYTRDSVASRKNQQNTMLSSIVYTYVRGLPDTTGDDMVLCDSCQEWFHLSCLNLTESPSTEKWFCTNCLRKSDLDWVAKDNYFKQYPIWLVVYVRICSDFRLFYKITDFEYFAF